MASVTSVVGNRVTIDDAGYDIKSIGENQYKVLDEFAVHLGDFRVRGRAVDAEDYGVEGAHPIAKIGKLWVEANYAAISQRNAKPALPTCRILQHDAPDAAALAKATAYVTWLKKQPGVLSAHLAHDATTQKTVSITVWASQEQAAALKSPPEGAAPLPPASSEILPLVV